HRLRAGREPQDRPRRHRGKRRLRRARRSADRAHGARLLPARQAAAGHAAGRRGRRARRRGAGERLMAMESALPLRRIVIRFAEGIDGTLLVLTATLSMIGLAALFSASYETPARLTSQLMNLGVAFAAMW